MTIKKAETPAKPAPAPATPAQGGAPAAPAKPAAAPPESKDSDSPAAALATGEGSTEPQGSDSAGGDADPAAVLGESAEDGKATASDVLGAPEKYELKAPEGAEFDPAVLSVFEGAARSLNLSGSAAQQILDALAPALQTQQAAQVEAMVSGWLASTKADPEIGGAKLKASVADAAFALSKVGTPELRALLGPVSRGGTGLGNHPEILRLLARVAKVTREDESLVTGPAPEPRSERPADRVYGKGKKQ